MSQTISIFKREFLGYFATPIAYVFLAIFVFLSGIFTFYLGSFFQRGHLPSERRLRQAKRPGSTRERSFLNGGQKGPNLVPVKRDRCPIHAYSYIGHTDICNFF